MYHNVAWARGGCFATTVSIETTAKCYRSSVAIQESIPHINLRQSLSQTQQKAQDIRDLFRKVSIRARFISLRCPDRPCSSQWPLHTAASEVSAMNSIQL